jgi:quinoprotein glucose dehydrogenase
LIRGPQISLFAHVITLFESDEYEDVKEVYHDSEVSPQSGAKFGMKRELLMSIFGAPCNDPPWGELIAVDLADGSIKWRSVLGTTEGMIGVALPWGTPNFGGPMMTASGLIFIGAAMDDYIRAFDTQSGQEVWKAALPAGGQATPMSYEWQGKQYVLIAAGGHSTSGTTLGDYVVSFALPD